MKFTDRDAEIITGYISDCASGPISRVTAALNIWLSDVSGPDQILEHMTRASEGNRELLLAITAFVFQVLDSQFSNNYPELCDDVFRRFLSTRNFPDMWSRRAGKELMDEMRRAFAEDIESVSFVKAETQGTC
jgi:hypothetical protein